MKELHMSQSDKRLVVEGITTRKTNKKHRIYEAEQ